MVDYIDSESGKTVLTDEYPQLAPFGKEEWAPVAFEVKGQEIWVTEDGEVVDAGTPGAFEMVDLEHRFNYERVPFTPDDLFSDREVFIGRTSTSDEQSNMMMELMDYLRLYASAVYFPEGACGTPIFGYIPQDGSRRLVFMRLTLETR